ncbi:hypothetical protein LEUCIP111803_01343 [Leucobacter soli]|uniref:Uncharacterized protein n=1 Tax=Leucobacter soli TaxID=2812850 RepID=A0A916JWF5_9MICO|nr:hypothetical protein LEUCIP111803_01343 [Leucobacter soli]
MRGILLEGAQHERVELRREPGAQQRGLGGGRADVGIPRLERGVAEERRQSGQEEVEQTAHLVEVAPIRDRLSPCLLGREVERVAQHADVVAERRLARGARDAEVDQPDRLASERCAGGDVGHDVRRGHITVHEAGQVHRLEGVEHRVDRHEGVPWVERAPIPHQCPERAPRDEVGRDP